MMTPSSPPSSVLLKRVQGQSPWPFFLFDELPSTSDFCRARAEAGEGEMAVLARRQTRGRGTRGRAWVSGAGNLFLSVLLRRRGGLWSLRAGVALAEAVAPLLPAPGMLRLKWPNDLLLAGRKVAGVLVESAVDAGGQVDWVVIGMGLNLAVAPDVPGRATAAVAEVAKAPEPEEMAGAVLERLDDWLRQDAAAVRAAWSALGPQVGAPMRLSVSGEMIEGDFAGLAEDGGLRLRTGGRERNFAAGEVLEG